MCKIKKKVVFPFFPWLDAGTIAFTLSLLCVSELLYSGTMVNSKFRGL